ncbi:4536_t:CDS:2, partial [Cetraspora pellucida]
MFKSLGRPNAGPIGARNTRPDYKQAREWEENRFKEISISPIYLHQPTFAGISGTINGDVNNGTFNEHSERIISKRNLKEHGDEERNDECGDDECGNDECDDNEIHVSLFAFWLES